MNVDQRFLRVRDLMVRNHFTSDNYAIALVLEVMGDAIPIGNPFKLIRRRWTEYGRWSRHIWSRIARSDLTVK
jgi:hypothetical protein